MYKILVNTANNEILACGKTFKHQPEDVSYLIDNEYGIGVHPDGVYSIQEVAEYVTPNKFLFEGGVVIPNPKYTHPEQKEIDTMKLMLADLALSMGGVL